MVATYNIHVAPDVSPSPADIALVWAEGIDKPGKTKDVPSFLLEVLNAAREEGETFVPAETRAQVRRMLRFGKYRASGRGKPASEFLLRAAIADEFPLINGPVDVCNAISLASGFPGSLFDVEVCGKDLLVRRGAAGEQYVFNASGQSIDLTDLLLVCRRVDEQWQPCGNPVKDSEATKIRATTKDVVAVLYIPAEQGREVVESWAGKYAALLESHCQAQRVGWSIAWSDPARHHEVTT